MKIHLKVEVSKYVGKRRVYNHFLDLGDFEIVYVFETDDYFEDTVSDYISNWKRLEISKTKPKIVTWITPFTNEVFTSFNSTDDNNDYITTYMEDNKRMMKWKTR